MKRSFIHSFSFYHYWMRWIIGPFTSIAIERCFDKCSNNLIKTRQIFFFSYICINETLRGWRGWWTQSQKSPRGRMAMRERERKKNGRISKKWGWVLCWKMYRAGQYSSKRLSFHVEPSKRFTTRGFIDSARFSIIQWLMLIQSPQ